MWPRLFAQLFDLVPHITRLIPIADTFFASRLAGDRASESAIRAMAEGVRGDLGQVTAAHAGLSSQLQELSAQIVEVGHEVRTTRTLSDQQQHRIETLEQQVGSLGLWIKGGISVLVVLGAVIIALLLHLLHSR